MKRLDIIIPYVKGPENGLELRYALRSIEKNLNYKPIRIILVGEIPYWITGVETVPMHQIEERKYRTFFDQMLKLHLALTQHNIGDQFIWTYDDVYFTKPVTLEDIGQLKAVASLGKYPNLLENCGAGPNWLSAFNRSLEAAKADGGTDYNYETHLPRLFSKQKMLKLMDRFHVLGKPYLISTLYYNIYHKTEEPLCLYDSNPGIRFLLRSTFDVETLKKHLQKHLFTNNDPGRWSPMLKSVLAEMFPKASKYEKK